MLNLTVSLHRKNQGYEVRSIISFKILTATPKERQKHLTDMQHKLEQILPGGFKAKYNIVAEELTVCIPANKAGEASSILHKMEDHIKSAATMLKLR